MKLILRLLLSLLLITPTWAAELRLPAFRPPAVPLVAHDPYFSIWSIDDKLTDKNTVHWTGAVQPLHCMVRINGEAYRLMGREPSIVPALPQLSLSVLPTRTICEFGNSKVKIKMTFLTPALPSDLDLLSRPLTYIIWDAESLDAAKHQVEVYFDCGPQLVVNTPDQIVELGTLEVPGLNVISMGSKDQPVLEKTGDRIRIDWGHAYVGIRTSPANQLSTFDGQRARDTFASRGRLPLGEPDTGSKSPITGAPVIAAVLPLGKVGMLNSRASCHVLLAYDDESSVRYFGETLQPYWRRHGMDAPLLLDNAEAELPGLIKRCEKFDEQFMQDMARVGGPQYALVTALAYRQTLAGCKLVADSAGAPLFFPKENDSNGCIGTVDVIYPMSPFCLMFSPALAKGALVPVLDYAQSDRWSFPYAPHDLGQYPHATGQVYGGGEKSEESQMPVEESANMLLMMAGIAKVEGNADFAGRYWPLLEQWASYLKQTGWDPGEQLCTDDFTGPMPHNANLSAKAICALGAFGQLCEMRNDPDTARRWHDLARDWVDHWVDAAYDHGHYRLAFDQPNTWSQKYNLVWDRLLGLDLFPANVIREEMDYYFTQQLEFGLPLDSRATFTKLDWIFWTACLTGDRKDMERLLDPAFKFVNETFDRVPLTDWYLADTGRRKGFMARPVVGGLFMPALMDEKLRTKWSSEGEDYVRDWAPFPAATATNAPVKDAAPEQP